MTQYRKKPVVVEAVQWKGYPTGEMCAFIGTVVFDSGRQDVMLIETLEGTMRADEGDWIIRGVKGEFYPCKPDIFAATYELAAAPAAAPAPPADLRCWEHRPGRGHARRCIREKGHKGQHVDFEAQYWTTGDETSAAAPAPPDWTREAFNEQLTEDAERLLETLATGDGEHSEALDLNLIKAAFRHLLTWAASPAPAQAEGFCCLCCSQMQPCQDGCKCQTPPSAPDAETPK